MTNLIFTASILIAFATASTADNLEGQIYRPVSEGDRQYLIQLKDYNGTGQSRQINRCEYFGRFAETANERHQSGEALSSILSTVLDYEMDGNGPSRESYILRETVIFVTTSGTPQNGFLLSVYMDCIEQGW